jgi:Mce-associated membrane protein
VLAAAFFASTVLLAVVAAGLKADKDELADGRQQVAAAAGRFVETLLTYDHRDLGGYEDSVLALTAPPFSEQFSEAVLQISEGLIAAQEVSNPTVDDVFVADVDGETATTIVVYDRVLDGAAGPRTESNLYVRLGLVRQGGVWRVNDVVNLNLAFAESSPTTTTTAPAGG